MKLVLKVIQIFNTVIFFFCFVLFNIETEFEIIRNGTIYKIYDEVSDYHRKKVILKIRFQSILVFMKNNQDRKTMQNTGFVFRFPPKNSIANLSIKILFTIVKF